MNEQQTDKATFIGRVGPQRVVGGVLLAFRFKGGMLQYATEWREGTRGGIEWQNVPTVPADAPDIE